MCILPTLIIQYENVKPLSDPACVYSFPIEVKYSQTYKHLTINIFTATELDVGMMR
jgi:hypothetical protein